MADTLKRANEEFENLLRRESPKIQISRHVKYYYFLQGFKKGLEYERKK